MKCLLCQQKMSKNNSFTDLLKLQKETSHKCQECTQIFSLIADDHCPNCYKSGSQEQCSDCRVWERKGYPVSHKSLYQYNEAMKDYFSRYKFLGDYLLADCFANEIKDALSYYKDYIIVPIPISEKRMSKRRFNQVDAMLTSAKITFKDILEKREVDTQSSKTKLERLLTDQVFQLKEGERIPDKVLIVDDIYTTGQTIFLAKKLFLEAGVRKIESFSLAR